jgi:hypothetical protein
VVARLQAGADRNIERFGLLADDAEPVAHTNGGPR